MTTRTHLSLALGFLLVSALHAWAAPTCGRPVVRSGVASASNCVYDIGVSTGFGSAHGAAVARSGEIHPVTLTLGGRFTTGSSGGTLMAPGANGFSVRSWDSHSDYMFDGALDYLTDDDGYQCFLAMRLPAPTVEDIVRADGQVVGVRQTFLVEDHGDDLEVVLEAVAHGTMFEDSAVEMSATVTNRSVGTARVGIRYWSETAIFRAGIHACAFTPPDPPSEPWHGSDANWVNPLEDSLLLSLTEVPSIEQYYYFGALSAYGPWSLDPPATPPDRISASVNVHSLDPTERGGPGNTCFAWEAPDPLRMGFHDIEALAYFWGDTEATAMELAPGESTTVRLWTWAFIENPVTCIANGPTAPVECAGPATPVALDGSGSSTQEGNPLLFRWSSSDPRIRFDDPSSATPTVFLPGPGVHDITLDVGIGPYTKSASLAVEVVDTTAPALDAPPDLTLRSSDSLGLGCTVRATLRASALDACDGAPTITHVTIPDIGSGGTVATHDFPLGTTRVVFTATDGQGNVATGETLVTLVDDVAPTISLRASPERLWPPNHRLHRVHVDAELDDDCDPAPRPVLERATSNEPDDERGDGAFEHDVQEADVGTADVDVLLRAERSGRRAGRVYALRYAATDASGNTAVETVTVGVAHDQRRTR